ncbi:MAG: hypothetical protein R3344_07915, partial [Acidobacteriota bacterium]|nr:hypothetical protein [Acidobacteriota bacterium]
DPTEVDAGHYKVEFENDRVRVLRIKYGPGETSVMHYHPNNIAVFLTDLDVKMKSPGGTEQEVMTAAGTHMFAPPEHHLPTNGEGPLEVILVELK